MPGPFEPRQRKANPDRPGLTTRAAAGRPVTQKPATKGAEGDVKFNYTPQPRQKVFHACPADVVLYGGAAGGGKSMALLAELYVRAREIPGSYNIAFRRTFPELEKSLILKSRQMFPRAYCRYNEMTHRWTVRPRFGGTDSIIDFGYCRNAKEAEENYKSAEFTTLGVDEATLHDWDTIRFLMSRSRSSIPGAKTRILFCSNPGGIGHMWAKEYFGIWQLDDKRYVIPEKVFTPAASEEDPMPLSRCFVPAKLVDNPALVENDPTYRAKLMLLPVHQRKMLLEGDWEVFEGRFFPEFGKAHVVAPFDIPRHWKVYRSIDYGFTAPFCCLWFAVAPDGHIYVIREAYVRGLRDKEQAILVRDMSTESVEYTTADPSVFNKNTTGISIAENYLTVGGIGLFPSKNDRVMGWMACRNMLAKHSDGSPILKVFSSCVNLIREVEMAVFSDDKERHPDDINLQSRHDHAMDAWRYFAVSRPLIPREPETDPYARLDEASRREWMRHDEKIRNLQKGDTRAVLHGINREEDDALDDLL